MDCSYSWRWEELRRLRSRFRSAVLAAVAVLVLVFLSKFEPRSISQISVMLLVVWIFFG